MPIIDMASAEGKEFWCSCEKELHTFPELTNHSSAHMKAIIPRTI